MILLNDSLPMEKVADVDRFRKSNQQGGKTVITQSFHYTYIVTNDRVNTF
ncbi:MAG: hypothetical protein AAGA16_15510 [Cyanobacteria bacterium P01_E01_bin.35]